MQRLAYVLTAALTLGIHLTSVAQATELWLETGEPGANQLALALETDVHIEVNGLLAVTAVTQRFVNHTGQWAEGRYLFPLPDNISVDRLQIVIGDRLIEGEIQERRQAEQTYRRARDSGRAAGLVEQERPNLFSTRVANIPPGETIEIRIGFNQQVDYAHGRFSLRFPTTVAPRYVPGQALASDATDQGLSRLADTDRVPDASRISTPVHSPAAGPFNPLSLRVDLNPGMALSDIHSSFHEIETHAIGNGWQIELADVPDSARRDFELTWTPDDTGGPITAVFNESANGHEHALIMLTPPESFRSLNTPREVILIIDTSGSMNGEPIVQAREALQFALASLAPGDRFNVIEFNHLTRPLFDRPVEVSDHNLMKAQRWVDQLRAGGGTEMSASLAMAMHDAVPAGFLRQIVFVTDGLIGNEREVLEQVRTDIGESRLFTVGIGHGVNSAFLREAAGDGRGTFTFIGELDQIARRMSELVMQLESPVLHDIELQWPGAADVHPQRLPDLYVGQPLMITARTRRMTGDLVIRAMSNGQLWEEYVPLEGFQPARGVAAQWARSRIGALEAIRGAERNGAEAAILATALDYQVLSSQTSLVAVDRTPIRSRQDAMRAHNVPTLAPHGRSGQLRAMPSTDAGASASIIRGLVALLLVLLLFGHRRFSGEDGEQP